MTASPIRRRRGLAARRDGRRGEVLCALWLMAKGYRILGFRLKTSQAEIDLLAVTPRQRDRLLRAAGSITARRPDLTGAAVRLDLIALAPGRWPRHIRDAWRVA
jgi:putative endonuclease